MYYKTIHSVSHFSLGLMDFHSPTLTSNSIYLFHYALSKVSILILYCIFSGHKDGYIRIASEVFIRIVQNRKASEKHFRRIEEFAHKTGVVRLLCLYMVAGERDYQGKVVGANSHIMI